MTHTNETPEMTDRPQSALERQEDFAKEENKIFQYWRTVRTKAISELFYNKRENGIYSTTEFFNTVDDFVLNLCQDRQKMISEGWRQCAEGQDTTQFCSQLEKYKAAPTVENLNDLYEKSDEQIIQGNEFYLRGFNDRGNYTQPIPKSLEECRLKEWQIDNILKLVDIGHPRRAILTSHDILFENFHRLLQSVELPSDEELVKLICSTFSNYGSTDDDIIQIDHLNYMGAANDLTIKIKDILSLLLLSERSKHEAEVAELIAGHEKEMEEFAEWLQINKFKFFGQDIIATMTNIDFGGLLKDFQR